MVLTCISIDKEYYKQVYHDGVYEIPSNTQSQPQQENITVKLHKAQRRLSRTAYFILTGVIKPKDEDQGSPRCSENYNKRRRNDTS